MSGTQHWVCEEMGGGGRGDGREWERSDSEECALLVREKCMTCVCVCVHAHACVCVCVCVCVCTCVCVCVLCVHMHACICISGQDRKEEI